MLYNVHTLSPGRAAMAACPRLPGPASRKAGERGAPQNQPSRATDILAISPNPTLSLYLGGLFDQLGWVVARRGDRAGALEFLVDNLAPVAVCEPDLPDGTWKDALTSIALLPGAPSFVVIGDEQSLWNEVTRLGGFDVLVRPLRQADVLWTVASAWHHWMTRNEARAAGPKAVG